ncbi:zinc-dependent metalloprotease [Streptomyces sp. NPDC002888]|uniref:zinc-dependent metalloprotease n=1 Tax=Streptomyces sp. NPDC002888 TaxID=3364668 RepID=UPI003675918D
MSKDGSFLDLVPDPEHRQDRLLLGIRRFDEPFLLTVSLSQGLGSSALQLDRGRAGKARSAQFRRVGDRILFAVRNKHFLTSGDAAAVRAGEESFALSVVWSGPVLREEDGAAVVDATDLVLYDHDRVAEHLCEEDQGEYALDASASLPLVADSRSGPRGVRLPALLTFRGPGRGKAVRAVAADPRAVTVVQQLNLLRLPDSPLPPRRYHPASGGYGIGHDDHALVGLADRQVRFQPRFRVEPGGPAIVFQVDPAIPEPFRSAVVEGGNWWRDGFARIGFPDAYRVEVGGDDFDPYDPDVNGVVWVHRAGRGWSLGQGLTDPRTGEILHARVRLGSQRIEQVRALGESLLAPYGRPDEAERIATVEELVLARLRQLAAHEIGHALGFMHNFASTHHPKPSVMDYPHARIRVTADDTLDLSAAYATGLGPWDHFLVAHAYGHFPDEDTALAALRRQAAASGLAYVTDTDAQGPHAAHADGVPWVTSPSALEALDTVLRARRIALDGFSHAVLPPDRQTGELEERAALLHLLHRHEVTAVARLVGGVRYTYGLAGERSAASTEPADAGERSEGGPDPAGAGERSGGGTEPVDADTQQRALRRLAALLRAEHLALPTAVLDTLTPPAIRYTRTDQYLDTAAGHVFDPFEAVRAAAALVTEPLLEPTRLNRLAWQHAVHPKVPGVTDLLDALLAATWHRREPLPADLPGGTAVQHTADWTLLNHLLATLDDPALQPPVRSSLRSTLRRLATDLRRRDDDHAHEAADLIGRHLTDPGPVRLDRLPRVPPGAPN